MADYPISCYEEGSSIAANSGTTIDISDGGILRGRRKYGTIVYTITLKHTIEASDLQTLLTFYDTYADELITWDDTAFSPSDEYNVYFMSPPSYTPKQGPYWEVQVELQGTKA